MNILLTRPLIDTEDLMGKLFSLGHKIIHVPTLKILAANIDPINAKKYDAFIFTSANSIRNLKLIKQEGTNIYDLFKFKNVLMTSSSVKKIQERILNEKN